MLFATFLLFDSLAPLAIAVPSSISPRKSSGIDPYIVCGDIPPLSSIPQNYLQSWYPTTLELCSALNGAARNIGCICHTSTSTVHCDETIADPVLWNTRIMNPFLSSHNRYMHEFCDSACYCTSTSFARGGRRGSNSRASATTTTDDSGPTNSAVGVIHVPLRNRPTVSSGTRRPVMIQANATSGAQGGGGRNLWQNQCGSNCTSNADCTGGGDGCTCLAAQKSTFEPAIGTLAFVAACIVSLASTGNGLGGQVGTNAEVGGGGKRSTGGDVIACPCNTTYVSSKCCDVSDGLVWEGKESKLGELVR